MKRILPAFLLPVVALVLLMVPCSCEQDTTLTITTDILSYHVGPDGGSFDAVVFTNGIWTASSSDSLAVTITPASGDYTQPVHIEVGPNDEHFTKSIRVSLLSSVESTTRTARIAITQDCHPFLDAAETEGSVDAAGGAVRFSVNGNEEWKLVSRSCNGEPSDFAVDPSTHGPNNVDVALWIPVNETGAPRTFTAVLALVDHPSVSVTLTVHQGA